jgi:integrase
MQFYKRPGSKFWWFKFVYRGVRYQESTKQTNRRKAEDLAAAFRLRLIEDELNVKRKKAAPTFSQAMAQYLESVKEQHPDHPATVQRYTVASKPLLQFFGNKLLNNITPDDVARYRSQRMKQTSEHTGRKLKAATVNMEMTCIKAIFSMFVKNEVILRNPTIRIKALPMNNEQMRVLSFEEEQSYLGAAAQPLKDAAILMLETGMRPEEVCRLTKGNIHLDENYVYNPYGKTKAARRRIPLTKRAADVLRERVREVSGDYIFSQKLDPTRYLRSLQDAHKAALKRIGVDRFRIYDLRHTFATRASESGTDLITLAALLGHSRIQMVMRYAHPTAGHQVSAIKKFEQWAASRQMEEFQTGDPTTVN